jgi:hypothetical protein
VLAIIKIPEISAITPSSTFISYHVPPLKH